MRAFWCIFASEQSPNGWICNFSYKTFGLQRDIWLCPISFTVLLSPPCNTADLVQDIWCGFKIPPIERYGPLNSTGYRLTHPYTPNIADKAPPSVQIPKQPWPDFSLSSLYICADVFLPIIVNGDQMWIQYQLLSRIKERGDKARPNMRRREGERKYKV